MVGFSECPPYKGFTYFWTLTCEGIDLNGFVHSQWHKHTKAA